MKIFGRCVLSILIILAFSKNAFSGTFISGRSVTHFYSWQTRNKAKEDYLRVYQSFIFNLGARNISFHTYLRTAYDFRSKDTEDPTTRIYNAYLDWNKIGKILDLRLGRQFLHAGVGSGTLDGLKMTIGKRGFFTFTAYAGAEAPFSREAKLQKVSKNSLWGAYLSSNYLFDTHLGISFVQRNRNGRVRWRQAGIIARKTVASVFSFFGRCDYDLKAEKLQEFLLRLRYQQASRLSLYSELGRRKPRIAADSFFSLFDLRPYDWIRVGWSYKISNWGRVSTEYRLTKFKDTRSSRISFSADFGFLFIGVANQTGYGGKNLGVFGGVRREFGDKFLLSANINFSRYHLSEIETETENTLFSFLRISYRPLRQLRTEVRVQNLSNPLYKKDVRILGTLAYSFRYGR